MLLICFKMSGNAFKAANTMLKVNCSSFSIKKIVRLILRKLKKVSLNRKLILISTNAWF